MATIMSWGQRRGSVHRTAVPRGTSVRRGILAVAAAALFVVMIGAGLHLYVEATQEWYFTLTTNVEQIGPFTSSHDCENARLIAGTSRAAPCRRTR